MASNPNIDDETREKAMASVANLPTKKPRVVSKKELEESGLSLRDFLNRERGLTRRKSANESASSEADPIRALNKERGGRAAKVC